MQFVFEICCIAHAAEIDPCELFAVCTESQLCRASAKCIKSYNITLQMMIPFPFFCGICKIFCSHSPGVWLLTKLLLSPAPLGGLFGVLSRALFSGSGAGGLCQHGGDPSRDPPNREHQESSPKPLVGLISFGFVTRVRDALL